MELNLQMKVDSTRAPLARLACPLTVRGEHYAPPGHNRDVGLAVSFQLVPAEDGTALIPDCLPGIQILYVEAVEGLVQVLSGNPSGLIGGFSIAEIAIGPDPLDALLPISCRKAGAAAARQIVESLATPEGRKFWSLADRKTSSHE